MNNTFPFSTDAVSSTVLALPMVHAWLSSHSISIDDLRPYLTLWQSSGNPYDYAQTTVGFTKNDTVYGVYQYILGNGTVIGVWVSESKPTTVGEIYTYPSQGGILNWGYTVSSEIAVGHQAQDSSVDGAEYNSSVFSDLSSPPPANCSTYCWMWSNWLGTSNYDWTTGTLPSHPFFLQVIIDYWGGNVGKPTNCGSNSYSSNCVFFQYLDDTTTLSTTSPGVGDWSAGDSITMEWVPPTANCSPAGGVNGNDDWVVELKITDLNTGQYASSGECFPDNAYLQFLEERPQTVVSGTKVIFQNPEFGTHDFWGALDPGATIPLNSGSNTWLVSPMYNTQGTDLAKGTVLNNGAHGSTWSDSWLSSQYP